ncbi:hypothetical protein ACH5RR_015296 [Cinchona calisaya]|uniref:Uncharacterized protein n=1 Tax=Cinchona calisaya TaxID=153742 RepID=A0ABD2ZSQ6_9GENT
MEMRSNNLNEAVAKATGRKIRKRPPTHRDTDDVVGEINASQGDLPMGIDVGIHLPLEKDFSRNLDLLLQAALFSSFICLEE